MKYEYDSKVTFNIADIGPFPDFGVNRRWEYSADYIAGWIDIVNKEVVVKVLYTNNKSVFKMDINRYYHFPSPITNDVNVTKLINKFVVIQHKYSQPDIIFSISDFNESVFLKLHNAGEIQDKIISTFGLRALRLRDVYFDKFRCYNDFYNSQDFVEYDYTGVLLNEVDINDLLYNAIDEDYKAFITKVLASDFGIDYTECKEDSETGSFKYGINYINLTAAKEKAESEGKEVYVIFTYGIPVDIMIK